MFYLTIFVLFVSVLFRYPVTAAYDLLLMSTSIFASLIIGFLIHLPYGTFEESRCLTISVCLLLPIATTTIGSSLVTTLFVTLFRLCGRCGLECRSIFHHTLTSLCCTSLSHSPAYRTGAQSPAKDDFQFQFLYSYYQSMI